MFKSDEFRTPVSLAICHTGTCVPGTFFRIHASSLTFITFSGATTAIFIVKTRRFQSSIAGGSQKQGSVLLENSLFPHRILFNYENFNCNSLFHNILFVY